MRTIADRPDHHCDVLVLGAGAAGLLAALAARGTVGADGRGCPSPARPPDVVVLNNEPRLGLKILVSGGGRCNLTNARVEEGDYDTDLPRVVRGLLLGFSPESIRTFFDTRGCPLHEEDLGKVFPRSNKARQVLEVLLEAVSEAGMPVIAPATVTQLEAPSESQDTDERIWRVTLAEGATWTARKVILATGGKSLPKTGSRGFGLGELARLGHTIVPPLPALTPLRLHRDSPLAGLAGLTVPTVLTLAHRDVLPEQLAGIRYRPRARAAGSMLVTHKGVTGPSPLDVSGACGRAIATGDDVVLHGDFWSLPTEGSPWSPFQDHDKQPGASLPVDLAPRPPTLELFQDQMEAYFTQRDRTLAVELASRLPRSLVDNLLQSAGLDPNVRIRQLDAPCRRQLYLALTQADLRLTGSEGYEKAEVTAGGVLLGELDRRTLESRLHPGLYCCGEVVNVTGRLGGFNFQWAWSSGYAAGRGAST